MRTSGPLYVGGVLLSYSHADSAPVAKLYERLKKAGITVWLDRHVKNAERQKTLNQDRTDGTDRTDRPGSCPGCADRAG